MPATRGPAVPRRRLGAELRRLRDDAGLLIEDVARELECSPSKISRLETGKGIPKIRDVRDMLSLYSVAGPLRDRLLQWARDGQQQGWWQEYSDVLQRDAVVPAHLDNYVAIEADAVSESCYQGNLVHGLLQTARYAHAVIEALPFHYDSDDVDRLVELRLRRQQVLHRDDLPLELHMVLDEAVLKRPIGGLDVKAEQLRKLLRDAVLPNITIQVVPFDIGVHQGLAGSFEIMRFADSADSELVYVESLTGSAYLEGDSDLTRYREAFDEITRKALTPAESARLIKAELAVLTR